MPDMNIVKLPDAPAVARSAADLILSAAANKGDAFHLSLSGGSTPKVLYQLLATPEYATRLPWDSIKWYFGDERCVPADDDQSNYRMVREAMFDPASVPSGGIFRVPTELSSPADIASAYDRLVRENVPACEGVPQFDLILLGMGTDGHTASLFPGTTALVETRKAVVENYVEKLSAWRITFTIPVLLAAKQVAVLVTGDDKAEPLSQVLNGPLDVNTLPSQCLRDRTGETLWLVDEKAVRLLG